MVMENNYEDYNLIILFYHVNDADLQVSQLYNMHVGIVIGPTFEIKT